MAVDAARHFLTTIVDQVMLVMQRTVEDNDDVVRFGGRRRDFDPQFHRHHLLAFVSNHAAFCAAWDRLVDERSRTLFVELLLYRMAGHTHVRLSTNTAHHWEMRRQVAALPSVASTVDVDGGRLGSLRHFEQVEVAGHRLSYDGFPDSLVWSLLLDQYYFERDGVRIRPEPGDHVIDGGACMGETALAFASSVGDAGHVHSFEPVAANLEVLDHNLRQNPKLATRMTVHPYGLGAADVDADAPAGGDTGEILPGFRISGDGSDGVSVRTVDGMVERGEIDRVDFVKMDIEGSEMAALQGAVETIRRFRPRLAISAYHLATDMAAIPLFIDRLGLGYRLHLDHYTIHHEETVVYATVD